ncbi:hypothetical protein GCM10025865_29970 [Paraoerskovia sediminicola]|uniref:N-acetyltransferase domain-containing protein n=1 Tax=Paraoerskovia sediminicola TaxID=1138587 RepID=A0ABM8G6B0_9CELL|nr:hypothetical protein GCM10025865_29970 [Paraoerskovia sediminicola]
MAAGWRDDTGYTWAVRAPGGPGDSDLSDSPDSPDGGAGRVLAMVGIHVDRSATRELSGEIGYWCAPDARGRGLMRDAARLVVDWALDPEGLGLARVTWQAEVGNWASRRVAWSLGLRVEGTIRKQLAVPGGTRADGWFGTILAGDPREPVEVWPAEAATSGVLGR